MRRGYFYFLRLAVILALLYGVVKLSGLIPTDRLSPFVTDKIAALQKAEQFIWLSGQDFAAAFQYVASQRRQDKEQKILDEKQLTEKSLAEALIYENNRLRNMLSFSRNYSGVAIPAEVVGRSGDQWFRFVTVDKGSAAGLRQSMTAVDPDGLVGYVYELGNNSAKIILLTDPLVSISCVNERTGDIYVLTGSTAGRLEIQYATLHSDIAVGDKLLTSGYSYRFRKGIPVATVVSVTLPKNSLAKKATAKPLANITGLDILFLIR